MSNIADYRVCRIRGSAYRLCKKKRLYKDTDTNDSYAYIVLMAKIDSV